MFRHFFRNNLFQTACAVSAALHLLIVLHLPKQSRRQNSSKQIELSIELNRNFSQHSSASAKKKKTGKSMQKKRKIKTINTLPAQQNTQAALQKSNIDRHISGKQNTKQPVRSQQHDSQKKNAAYISEYFSGVKLAAPEYPPAAKRWGYEGKTLLKISLAKNGKPNKVQITKSSGHPILDEAAAEAVIKQWQFPKRKEPITFICEFEFLLNSSSFKFW